LIRGDHSDVLPLAVADTMIEIKPGTQLVEIPGAGHAPALMSAMETRIVREFLKEARGARAVAQKGLRSAAA
jgi:pimeloyl-ACP methyl ester carboxylesterase